MEKKEREKRTSSTKKKERKRLVKEGEGKKSAEGYELSFSPFHERISVVTLFHDLGVPSARQPEEGKEGRGEKEFFFQAGDWPS